LKNGTWYSYGGVPAWRVRGLLKAGSAGRYFNDYIRMYADAHSLTENQMRLGHPLIPAVIAQSLKAVEGHVPEKSLSHLNSLLGESPAMIKIVKDRKSKHGDCSVLHKHKHAYITLNEKMPPYQALFTLLHELAHAEVSWRDVDKDQSSHGDRWKFCFSRILFRAAESNIFPADLARLVYQHALNPSFATYVDEELDRALDAAPENLEVASNPMGIKQSSVNSSAGVWSVLAKRLLGFEKTNFELESYGKLMSDEMKDVSLAVIRFLSLHSSAVSDPTTVKRLAVIHAHTDTSFGLMYFTAVRYREVLSSELQQKLSMLSPRPV
jgi:hypothetical protein